MNEELLELIKEWSLEQLEAYILKLETRISTTEQLVREVRVIRRNKSRRKTLDNGERSGK